MESARETDATKTDSFEDGPLTPRRIGAAAGAMDVVVFTAIGYVVFDDLAIGGIAGLMVGIGIYWFHPLSMARGEDGKLADLEPADDPGHLRSFHRFAAGYALSAAGIALFASGLLEMGRPVGLLAALGAAGVVYLGAGFVMPNARLPESGR
ncbi:hypothetical protein [Haloterrigena alkaliphila]|uniref:Uncharacterized protein n=1 Tax=Haloterrigena alkaliphila TaxID=2816475 RepID=A0A8A2VC53_9EURY|nr:hypothetical protein [Haloterrigena alkaliphila]QSW97755.1 hypothetical protein J0X25_10010 [Haloterrigena alkaliphila]